MGEACLQSQLWTQLLAGPLKDSELITKDQLRSSSQSVLSNKVTADRSVTHQERSRSLPNSPVHERYPSVLCRQEALPRWLLRFPSTITELFTDSTCRPSWSPDFALLLYLFSLLPAGLTSGTRPELHHHLLHSSWILPQCTALRGTHGQPPLPGIMPWESGGVSDQPSSLQATSNKTEKSCKV